MVDRFILILFCSLTVAPAVAQPPGSGSTPPATQAESSPPPSSAPPSVPKNPADATTPPRVEKDPRYGLLNIPPDGDVPPIVKLRNHRSMADLRRRAEFKEYEKEIGAIRRQYFGRRSDRLRQKGLEELREFTDPASFEPMIVELAREADDIQLFVLEHFKEHGEAGQAALAWTAINHSDSAIRHEAAMRLEAPAVPPVIAVLDAALRSADHFVASNAGGLAGALNVLETIPLLIKAQNVPVRPATAGDLAWIAVEKQTVYVERLAPVVGDASGAMIPITNTLTEGFVFRVVDAVVTIYRTEIHNSLVAMTTNDWGESTAALAYDDRAWADWYNNEYLPYKREQAVIEDLAK